MAQIGSWSRFSSRTAHRVRVYLDENGNGWFQVGDGPQLPPPTDPNVGYPPAIYDSVGSAFELDLYDGIAYPIVAARVESERLRFTFDAMTVYDAWCELQTPVLRFNAAEYGCTAEASVGSPNADGSCTTRLVQNGPEQPIDCAKLLLCNGACNCDEAHCGVYDSPDFRVDAALDDTGARLEGTIVIPQWTGDALPYTLRLKR